MREDRVEKVPADLREEDLRFQGVKDFRTDVR